MLSGDDLEAFGYYDMVDAYPEKDKSIQEMVEEFRVTMRQDKEPELQLNLMIEEWEEHAEAFHNGLSEAELKELADLVYVIFGYANSMGWDLGEAIRRVHNNNMERCIWPDGTIKRREDGKIIKNPNTPKVNLEGLV